MKAFRLTSDGLQPAGTICYPYPGFDYGLAADDTNVTGREHRSFVLHAFGRGPFFTHPIEDLEEIDAPDIPPPDDDHAKSVCKIGQGADCCRYLSMGAEGFSCEKLSPLGDTIDLRDDMTAKGDNCEGRGSR